MTNPAFTCSIVTDENFPHQLGTGQARLPTFLFNFVLRVLTKTNNQEKEIQSMQPEKEVKPTLSRNDIILYIKNSKESCKELLEPINEVSKVVEYKISIQK